MYSIQPYTYIRAKLLGVDVYPSSRKGKKIDVYKNGKYLYSIGALGMNDYPTYIKDKGIMYADYRRSLYHLRHKKDNVVGTRGW